jgi:tRNA dimethylallyltransferase
MSYQKASDLNLKNLEMKKKTAGIENTLIVIAGPTAVGKTSLSINLARHFKAEIISADSRQFYRELKIGTSFPTEEELRAARHHFAGHISIHDYYNVSRFENDVLQALEALFGKSRYALMTGGSGLYINAVCHGIDNLPDPDDNVRNRLNETYREKGLEALREQLSVLDPEYYGKVDLKNPNRIIRALEVCLQTGKKYSELRKQKPKQRDFRIVKIGLKINLKDLYERINLRVDSMIEKGLIEEARSLYPFRKLNALNTVGYKELFLYFEGTYTIEEAISKIKTNTRHYAKRQLTWFRKDKEIKWFEPRELGKIIEYIEE